MLVRALGIYTPPLLDIQLYYVVYYNREHKERPEAMLICEYKLDGSKQQYAAIDNAIRIVQFIRNKCLRLWMDERGISKNDLQCYRAVLAKEYSFASCLNSQARQASADRAWFAISRFYENCTPHKPGKKGYPQFQHNNRSVEYKQTGWQIGPRWTAHHLHRWLWHWSHAPCGNTGHHDLSGQTDQASTATQACRWLLLSICRASPSSH